METAVSRGGSSGFGWLVKLALIVILAALTLHAIEKHGQAAYRVHTCIEHRGSAFTWTNPDNGRKASVCEVEPGVFGAYIQEADNSPVTAFIKEKMRTIGQIKNYLANRGYKP